MRKLHYLGILLLILSLALMMGCSKDDETTPTGPGTGSNTVTIDPAIGGSVDYGDAAVNIPAGALNAQTDISVGIPASPPTYTQPANTDQVGETYEFGPAGTTFNMPIEVTFSYADNNLGSNDESSLTIMTFTTAGAAPVELSNVTVDETNNVITGETDHFSFFVLIISTSGGGGGDIPPEPQGGNPVGNWIFDYLSVPEIQNDSLRLTITGTGEGTNNLTETVFVSDLTLMLNIHIEMYISPEIGWYITNTQDTTYENISGTYVTQGVEMTTTITASTTNPEYIGDVRTVGYTAESNRLIFYQVAGSEGLEYNMYVVYRR